MVAAAVIGSAVVGGVMSSNASSDASDAQVQSARDANATQLAMFNQNRADQQPWMDRGNQAGTKLQSMLGLGTNNGDAEFGALLKRFSGDSVKTDPGYQFGLDQGLQAQQRGLSANGGLYSGAQIKAATRYGNDYATTKFGDAFNRDQVSKNQLFNMLSGVSGTGQTTANQVATQGTNTANGIAGNIIGAGNARASGYVGNANAWNNAIGQGINGIQSNSLLNMMRGGNATSSYMGGAGSEYAPSSYTF